MRYHEPVRGIGFRRLLKKHFPIPSNNIKLVNVCLLSTRKSTHFSLFFFIKRIIFQEELQNMSCRIQPNKL